MAGVCVVARLLKSMLQLHVRQEWLIILQQQALFSNWWAQAKDTCSVGLAGRFVFFLCTCR